VNWTNLGLIAAVITALIGAAVAIYRARPQKDLDTKTAQQIEIAAKREAWAFDRDRTIRLLRTEKYILEDIEYHHADLIYHLKLRDLLEVARTAGFLPADVVIPVPPVPPALPKFDDDV
jgi:hypothetical protein